MDTKPIRKLEEIEKYVSLAERFDNIRFSKEFVTEYQEAMKSRIKMCPIFDECNLDIEDVSYYCYNHYKRCSQYKEKI